MRYMYVKFDISSASCDWSKIPWIFKSLFIEFSNEKNHQGYTNCQTKEVYVMIKYKIVLCHLPWMVH